MDSAFAANQCWGKKGNLPTTCIHRIISKPSGSSVQGLKLLAPVVRKLGPNANPGKLRELPFKGALMWAFYAGIHLFLNLANI